MVVPGVTNKTMADKSMTQPLLSVKENIVAKTSLLVPGELTHGLQRHTNCKIQNGNQGATKLATVSEQLSQNRFFIRAFILLDDVEKEKRKEW